MTKRSLIVWTLAVSAVFLSACQSAEAEPKKGASQATNPAEVRILTAEEAQGVALSDAGVTAQQVTHLRTEYDVDDGVKEYEIEFYCDGWEYDYEIHAESGKIISKNKEKETADQPAAEQNTQPTVATEPNPAEPTEPQEKRISKEEAENIALTHADLTRGDVTLKRTEYDLDDGVPEYEIEFYANGWEYDYEIHAETGAVRSANKEKETADQPAAATQPTSTEPQEKRISKEEAENIALKHAGLARGDVTLKRTEYDRDDGVPQYEIEFRSNGWEYDYEIHAETGKILSSDKEWDD